MEPRGKRVGVVVLSGALAATSALLSHVLGDPAGLARPLALLSVILGIAPIAGSFVREALGRRFGVDALVVIAVAATALVGEYLAAALVTLMLNGGELLEDYVSQRSRRSIHALLKGSPQKARVLIDGEEREVPAAGLTLGSTVVVRNGELVPVDGVVVAGRASADEATLTGESLPVPKAQGSRVLAGSLVEDGFLTIEATSDARDSAYARIVARVQAALERRAPVERLADRYARWFTPVILLAALGGWLATGRLDRAVAILVVACPCSLVLATPTAVAAALGTSARRGILAKGGDVIERAGGIRAVLLDKTGTLTLGKPRVTQVVPVPGTTGAELLTLAASADKYSEHPLARAIVREAKGQGLPLAEPDEFDVFPGSGVVAIVDGKKLAVGNEDLLQQQGLVALHQEALPDGLSEGGVEVFVASDGRFLGTILLEDTPREGLVEAVQGLRTLGIRRIVMATGDRGAAAKRVATQAGIEEVESGLLPEEKADMVRELRAQAGPVMVVGDGVNDAPALAVADVGVAVGDVGTDAALEVADAAVVRGDLGRVSWFLAYSRRARRIIWQNIALGLALNLLGIALAFVGFVSPLQAAALHEGNALLVVFNSARLALDSRPTP